ncbi:hypothetical protein BBP40_005475 [Aspergillus hancockii]|nr:hypothetical protein BBP40_005475 [Aspergillus hancockii]
MSILKGAFPPPPEVVPSFDDPVNRISGCITLDTVFLTLISIALTMRLYTRWFIMRASLGLDDSYTLGLGRRRWDIPFASLPEILTLFNIDFYLYIICIVLIKLSILLFYNRIFSSRTTLRYLITFGIVIMTLASIPIIVLSHLTYKPVQHITDLDAPEPEVSLAVPSWYSGILSLATDIYVLVLPMPSVWKLRVPLRHKFRAITIFSLGGLACTASLIRLIETSVMINGDLSWDLAPLGIWAGVEINIGLLCSCLPLFSAFIHHHWTKWKSMWDKLLSKRHSNPSVEGSLVQNTCAWPGQGHSSSEIRDGMHANHELRDMRNLAKAHIPGREPCSARSSPGDLERGTSQYSATRETPVRSLSRTYETMAARDFYVIGPEVEYF